MLELSSGQIGGWISSFLLPLFRIGSMLMVMPIVGTQLVPRRIRLYFAVAFTLAIAPVLPEMPQVEALSIQAIFLISEQIIIGVLLGLVLQMMFHIFVFAGQLISMQMGLGFASLMDPASGTSVPLIGQFLLMLVTLLFLAVNGHLVVFEIMAESFTTLPVGQALDIGHYAVFAGRLSWVMGAALLLALPAVSSLLVINIAFGVMTRAAPQLNIFTIGFPLTLIMGMIIFWVSTAEILTHFQIITTETLTLMRGFTQ